MNAKQLGGLSNHSTSFKYVHHSKDNERVLKQELIRQNLHV